MRHFLTLMAATVFVAAPCPARAEPPSIDFPVEVGAPPRPLDPAMVILFRHTPLDEIAACAHPEPGQIAVGCARLTGPLCLVMIPPIEAVTFDDLLRIEDHEIRHCAGQVHVDEIVDGKRQLRWLP